MALLRILLIVILVYFILKFLGRLLFAWLYSQSIKNNPHIKENKAGEKEKEGEVTVQDVKKENQKFIDRDEGEYIDYEEIE